MIITPALEQIEKNKKKSLIVAVAPSIAVQSDSYCRIDATRSAANANSPIISRWLVLKLFYRSVSML